MGENKTGQVKCAAPCPRLLNNELLLPSCGEPQGRGALPTFTEEEARAWALLLLQSFPLQTGQAAGKIPFITDHHTDSAQGTAEFGVKTPAVPNLTAVHASRKKDRDYLHQRAWMEGANFTLPFV